MLKIKNSAGEELLRLGDDGTETVVDQKLKEEYAKAEDAKEGE